MCENGLATLTNRIYSLEALGTLQSGPLRLLEPANPLVLVSNYHDIALCSLLSQVAQLLKFCKLALTSSDLALIPMLHADVL